MSEKRKREPTAAKGPAQGREGRQALPDGCVLDFKRRLFSTSKAGDTFRSLVSLAWEQRQIRVYGVPRDEPRLTLYMGDNETLSYNYSGTTRVPVPWHPLVVEIKAKVAAQWPDLAADHWNTCLLNYYRDGKSSLAAHDDEDVKRYGKEPAIASVSFGSPRDFVMKRKDGSASLTYSLGEGAALLMAGLTQKHWTHEVPKRANAGPRVNLTFRHHNGSK